MTEGTRIKNRRTGRPPQDEANPVDIHVGSRIRLRRTLLGMSQETLGEAIGLTFQQVQKYERGANRVSASRLFDLSGVLDVPVSFFFDDMPEGVAAPSAVTGTGADDDSRGSDNTGLALLRHFRRIGDRAVQRRIAEMVKAVADASSGAAAEA